MVSSISRLIMKKMTRLIIAWILIMPIIGLEADVVKADTPVGGPIVSDTTWTLANSPYIVIANVEVWAGVTLTIEPGVVVKFDLGKSLFINGQFIAQGSVNNKIIFTSNQSSPQPGDWGQIYFSETSIDAMFDGVGNYVNGSILKNCEISYGGNNGHGVIELNLASPYIDTCYIQQNSVTGIYGIGRSESKPIVISYNYISNNHDIRSNGGGIDVKYGVIHSNIIDGNSTISPNYISNNGGGIKVYNSEIKNNTIINNHAGDYGGGIYASQSNLSNNQIYNNRGEYGAGMYVNNCNVTMNNVHDNTADIGYGFGGGIYTYNSNISQNEISNNNSRFGGGIYCESTSEPILNNLIQNNTSNYGGGVLTWGCLLSQNTIILNSADIMGSGVYLRQAGYLTEELQNNLIIGNYSTGTVSTVGGIEIVTSENRIDIHNNIIYDNVPYNISIRNEYDVYGENNYWGTTSSIDILNKIYDFYDDTSLGRFLYIPYLQDPDPNSPVPPPINLQGTFTNDSAILSWDAISSSTMGYGYKIYYDNDTSGPPYDGIGLPQGNSPIDVGSATNFTLTGINSQIYIAITAYDTLGKESWYSNQVYSADFVDNESPTVNWVAPVGNDGIYFIEAGIVHLEVTATDNVAIDRVYFYRYDSSTSQPVTIGFDYESPYQWDFDTDVINSGSNSIYAIAYDTSENSSTPASIRLYKGTTSFSDFLYLPAVHNSFQ